MALGQRQRKGVRDVVDVAMAPPCLAGADVAGGAVLACIAEQHRELDTLAAGPSRRAVNQRAADDDRAAAVRGRGADLLVDGVAGGALGDRLVGGGLVANDAAAGAGRMVCRDADAAGMDEGLACAGDGFEDGSDAGGVVGVGAVDHGVGIGDGTLQAGGVIEGAGGDRHARTRQGACIR